MSMKAVANEIGSPQFVLESKMYHNLKPDLLLV